MLTADVGLQEQLLEPGNRETPLNHRGDLLREFAGVVVSWWSSLAALLSLTPGEVEEVRRDVTGSPADQALHMLRRWREKVPEDTYSHPGQNGGPTHG